MFIKTKIIIVLLLSSMTINALSSDQVDVVNLEDFSLIGLIPSTIADIDNSTDMKLMDIRFVSELLQTKNRICYLDGIELKYFARCKFILNDQMFYVFESTNGYKRTVYLAKLNCKDQKPLLLEIYYSIGGLEKTFFSIEIDTIRVYSIIEQGNCEYPFIQEESYKLDESFSLINRHPNYTINDEVIEIVND